MPYPKGSPELVARAQGCKDSTALKELGATLRQLTKRRSYLRKFRPTAEELAIFDAEFKRISALAASKAGAQHAVAADELDGRLEQIELLAAQSRGSARVMVEAMGVARGMLPQAKRRRVRGSSSAAADEADEESAAEAQAPDEETAEEAQAHGGAEESHEHEPLTAGSSVSMRFRVIRDFLRSQRADGEVEGGEVEVQARRS